MADEILPRLDQFEDFGLPSRFDVLEDSMLEAIDELSRVGSEQFIAAHPEFHKTPWNSLTLLKFCADKNVPTTLRNLEIAGRVQASMLERKPAPDAGPLPEEVVIRRAEGRLATAEPTEGEASFLQKVADDPKLNDHQRKARDEKLRRAAIASRLANSSLRPSEDPQIVI